VKPRSLLRIALAIVAAALCVGLVGPPAVAHTDESDSGTSEVQAPALADVQAFVDRMITSRLDSLTALSAKVSANPDLDATAKDKITSSIEQAEAALTALKAQVDSAGSVAEVWSDVRAALATMPSFWWPWWWFHPAVHRAIHGALAAQRNAARLAAARLAAERRADKARAAARAARAARASLQRRSSFGDRSAWWQQNATRWGRGFDPRYQYFSSFSGDRYSGGDWDGHCRHR
jgi:hypothetical protein